MRLTSEADNLKENIEATTERVRPLEVKRRYVGAILSGFLCRLDKLIEDVRELARDAKRYAKGGE